MSDKYLLQYGASVNGLGKVDTIPINVRLFKIALYTLGDSSITQSVLSEPRFPHLNRGLMSKLMAPSVVVFCSTSESLINEAS